MPTFRGLARQIFREVAARFAARRVERAQTTG
jgi:hypothetical protein